MDPHVRRFKVINHLPSFLYLRNKNQVEKRSLDSSSRNPFGPQIPENPIENQFFRVYLSIYIISCTWWPVCVEFLCVLPWKFDRSRGQFTCMLTGGRDGGSGPVLLVRSLHLWLVVLQDAADACWSRISRCAPSMTEICWTGVVGAVTYSRGGRDKRWGYPFDLYSWRGEYAVWFKRN